MSTKNSKNHKRQVINNTEWLDELINKIENMKNKISKNQKLRAYFINQYYTFRYKKFLQYKKNMK